MVTLAPGVKVTIDDIVTGRFAILGMSGAGKNNAMAVMVEAIYDAGTVFTYLDLFGVASGFRSSADGKGPGLKVPIIGGYHGDLPLRADAGAVIARELYELDASAVLDLAAFTPREQSLFIADYANELFSLHLQRPKTRAVFLDEADKPAPQRPSSDADAASVVALWRLHTGGRAQGIGLKTATQSAAEQDKRTVKQAEMIIAMRTFSPLDQKPVLEYLRTTVESAKAQQIQRTLASLKDGEAWFIAPRLGIIKRGRFPLRRTFDSGSTPKVGVRRQDPVQVADVDLDRLRAALERDLDTIVTDDPVALRARIAQLQAQLKGTPSVTPVTPEIRIERVEVPVLTPEAVTGLQDAVSGLLRAAGEATLVARSIAERLEYGSSNAALPAPAAVNEAAAAPSSSTAPRRPKSAPGDAPGDGLKAGARRMLEAIHRVGRPLTRRELSTLADVTMGGTITSYLSVLRQHEYVTERDGLIALTQRGADLVKDIPAVAPSTEEILELHAAHLKRGMRAMLDLLVQQYPKPLKRAVLSAQAGVTAGGTMTSYMSVLRKRGLIEEVSAGVRAAEVLFINSEASTP